MLDNSSLHCTVLFTPPPPPPPKKKSLLLPTKSEIKGLVVCPNGANIHLSVPRSLQYPAMNLYTLVVDYTYFLSSREMGPYLRAADQRMGIGAILAAVESFVFASYCIWSGKEVIVPEQISTFQLVSSIMDRQKILVG